MGYRRSKKSFEAARDWSRFVDRNIRVIDAAGLPLAVTESISHWDDFLMHGYIDHHADASAFSVDQLSEDQYSALLQFVESYFASGYEYFTPVVLRLEDQQRFDIRFQNS